MQLTNLILRRNALLRRVQVQVYWTQVCGFVRNGRCCPAEYGYGTHGHSLKKTLVVCVNLRAISPRPDATVRPAAGIVLLPILLCSHFAVFPKNTDPQDNTPSKSTPSTAHRPYSTVRLALFPELS
jgi:hypothetical protein